MRKALAFSTSSAESKGCSADPLNHSTTERTLRASRCVLDRPSAFLSEDIGSVLKGGVKVCQRRLVNELLGPLVTEFVPNFGREGATPIQRSSNASLFARVQAVKIIRHTACRHLRSRPHRRGSPVARTRFKTLIYLKGFGVGTCGALVSTSKVLAQMNKT